MSKNEFVFRELPNQSELELVGDFEGLYKAEEDPWNQSGNAGADELRQYYNSSRTRMIAALRKRYGRVNAWGLEIGCGHGHVVDHVANVLENQHWEGMDISPTAIERASKVYPHYKFHVGDITQYGVDTGVRYDIIVLGQLLWYIMHRMDIVVENCYNMLVPGGVLVVSQAFLTKPQRYGASIADGFSGTVKLLLNYEPNMHLVDAHFERAYGMAHHDGLIMLQKNGDAYADK